LPNNLYFPFDTLEAKVARPDRWEPTPNRPIDPPSSEALAALSLQSETSSKKNKSKTSSSPLGQPQDALVVPHTLSEQNPVKKIDLASALQYGTAQGYPPLYYFIRQFTRDHMHPNCPYKGGPEVIMTCGNTDGLNKALLAFNNEWSEDKDWVRDREGLLCEEFAYMTAIQAAKPRGMNIVPVGIDDEGMRAEGKGGLKDVLENWDFKLGKRPHLMYTVT
jgi:DNA-binding transcriptional MocR family regulator